MHSGWLSMDTIKADVHGTHSSRTEMISAKITHPSASDLERTCSRGQSMQKVCAYCMLKIEKSGIIQSVDIKKSKPE